MRKNYIIFKILLFLMVFAAKSYGQTKHALIIAIGDYDPTKTGWGKLSSLNDVLLIQTALQKQDFKTENIKIVQNTNAAGISSAIEQLKIRIKAGDIVVIHYSGHGVQLQDDNGDEPDHLDEALVPLEAIYKPEELKTNKYLRDDTLGEWIFQLRKILGINGHLLFCLDSCHSGAGSRGNALARGGLPPLVEANFEINESKNPSQSITDVPTSRGNSNDGLSKFILFAGASSNEVNFETYTNGKSVGSLSYAFSKALSQLKTEDTYRQVFAKIRAEMALIAPRQNPIIEGDVDYQVFGGSLVKQTPYFELKRIQDATMVQLNAGSVAGINKNDVFSLYPAGTVSMSKDTALLEGIITESDYFTAILSLKKSLPMNSKAPQYWAFRTKQSYGDTKINVYVDNKNKIFEKPLLDSLQNWSFLKLVKDTLEADYKLKNTNKNELVVCVAATNLPYINMLPITFKNKDYIKQLKTVILSTAQVKFIKNLHLGAVVDGQLEFSLVRAELNNQEQVIKLYDSVKDTVTRRFSDKDAMVIKLTNTTKSKLFYNIIAIQPDEKVVPIIPSIDDSNDANSYQIEAGKTILLDYRAIGGFNPPCGTEMMKIFATPKPINLAKVIETQGEVAHRGKGEENPLELLMGSYYSRGPNVTSPSNIGYTNDYVYTIVGSKGKPCN